MRVDSDAPHVLGASRRARPPLRIRDKEHLLARVLVQAGQQPVLAVHRRARVVSVTGGGGDVAASLPGIVSLRDPTRVGTVFSARVARVDRVRATVRTGDVVPGVLATEALLPFEEALVRLFGPPIDEATVLVVLTAGLVQAVGQLVPGDTAESTPVAERKNRRSALSLWAALCVEMGGFRAHHTRYSGQSTLKKGCKGGRERSARGKSKGPTGLQDRLPPYRLQDPGRENDLVIRRREICIDFLRIHLPLVAVLGPADRSPLALLVGDLGPDDVAKEVVGADRHLDLVVRADRFRFGRVG
jgi:hypothetical protein